MKRPKTYHHGDLKSAMINAALELVREKGPRGFSLNEASRRAGVSVSAPYNHFKDKDALLMEIVVLGNRTLESELRAALDTEKNPEERLIALYLAYIAFAKTHPDLFAVMFQSGVDKTPYPEVHESAAAGLSMTLELAAEIEASAKLANELALAVWTMAHGFATLSAEGAFRGGHKHLAPTSPLALVRRVLFQRDELN